ncbi:MAG: amidohydrolase [Actinomycetota bacterium]
MTLVPHDVDTLGRWLAEHTEELIAFRRHLHAHPEVSWQEHATTEAVVERLGAAGLGARGLATGTGAVCDLGGHDGPVIALRADLDALAMADEKDVPYRSRVPGVAHACGHDVHTTIVLGAGLYLAHHLGEDDRRVRLIFQPAEEQVPGGAVTAIEDGVLDDVSAVYGLHCDPKLATGHIGLRPGPLTSAADMLSIRLSGPGGHTARPDETVDLVPIAGAVAVRLRDEITSRIGDPGDVRVAFGAIRAGDAPNVIPTAAELRASVRTPSIEVWDQLPEVAEAAVAAIVDDTGAGWTIDHTRGVPPVVNDPMTTALVDETARRWIGPDAVTEAVQSWGGDDFAWYLREVPGTYIRLGTRNPAWTDPPLDLHVGRFDADEGAIGVGIRLLVGLAFG